MNDIPDLETQCERCEGRRGYSDIEADNGWAECFKCDGTGFIPTAIGARVLDLIRHNSRVTVSAELRVSSAR